MNEINNNDNVQPANHVRVNQAQNINGSVPINDITNKVVYLLEQYGRQDEKLNSIQNAIFSLDSRFQKANDRIDRRIDSLDNRLSDNIKELSTRLNTNTENLNNNIKVINDKLTEKVDKNFKWIIGTLIVPIITMIITIIFDFLKK